MGWCPCSHRPRRSVEYGRRFDPIPTVWLRPRTVRGYSRGRSPTRGVQTSRQDFFKSKLSRETCAEAELEVQQAEVGFAVYGRGAEVEQGDAVLAAVGIEPVDEEY